MILAFNKEHAGSVRNGDPIEYESLESGEGYLKLRKTNDVLAEFPEIEEGKILLLLQVLKIYRSHVKVMSEDDQTSIIEIKWE